MNEWVEQDGIITQTYKVGSFGLIYVKQEDTTFGSMRYGRITVLDQKTFSLEHLLDQSNKEEVQKYLPKELTYSEAITLFKKYDASKKVKFESRTKVRKERQRNLDASKVKKELLTIRKLKKERTIDPNIRQTIHNAFFDFLEKVELVLSGEPFMHIYHKDSSEYIPLKTFSHFVSKKIYENRYCKKVDRAEYINTKKEPLEVDLREVKTSIKSKEISQNQFLNHLKSMLGENQSVEHKYFSPYRNELGMDEVKRIVDKIEIFFLFVSNEKWKFYQMETTEWDMYHDGNGFFDGYHNDSCFVLTDHQNYFLSLFINGSS